MYEQLRRRSINDPCNLTNEIGPVVTMMCERFRAAFLRFIACERPIMMSRMIFIYEETVRRGCSYLRESTHMAPT